VFNGVAKQPDLFGIIGVQCIGGNQHILIKSIIVSIIGGI